MSSICLIVYLKSISHSVYLWKEPFRLKCGSVGGLTKLRQSPAERGRLNIYMTLPRDVPNVLHVDIYICPDHAGIDTGFPNECRCCWRYRHWSVPIPSETSSMQTKEKPIITKTVVHAVFGNGPTGCQMLWQYKTVCHGSSRSSCKTQVDSRHSGEAA